METPLPTPNIAHAPLVATLRHRHNPVNPSLLKKKHFSPDMPTLSHQILVLNAGSSSIKFAVFDASTTLQRTVQGMIAGIGATASFAAAQAGKPLAGTLPGTTLTHGMALAWLLDWLHSGGHVTRLRGAGHRVVHGGAQHAAPILIDDGTLSGLEALAPLAPLHQPHNLAAIRTLAQLQPALPQVACFDTAFHRSQPAVAQALALPRRLTETGLRRYGFHGLSYEYIAGVLPGIIGTRANGRVIVAHLGNGASLCALRERQSVATTMGFSTLDGLVMGTRCGNIDPGALLYLMRENKLGVDALEALLYRESGLLGVSSLSSDMRTLLASTDPQAQFAIELFVYHTVLEIGALTTTLEGMDALVFTGGIGEHAAAIRAMICAKLGWMGIALDTAANDQHATRISTPGSRITACIIPTDEETVIARHTAHQIDIRLGAP